MQNILVPIDFSNNAQHAAQYASLLANQMYANITFLHIFSVPLVSEYNLPHEIESFIAKNRIDAIDDLKNFVKKFVHESGISENRISQRIEYGFVPEKIVAISKEMAVDLIVMGTKGVSNLIDRWLGTVAQKVVKKANCPVLIVSQKALIHLPKTILYAADFENDEVLATEKLLNTAHKIGAKCNLVHVHEKYELNVGHQIEAMATFLENKFKNDGLEVKIIVRENVENGLETYVENQKPDILAIAMHEKSFFDKIFLSSISEHFVQEAKLPILCFKKD